LDLGKKLIVSFRVVREGAGRLSKTFAKRLCSPVSGKYPECEFDLLTIGDTERTRQLDCLASHRSVYDLVHQ